MTNTRSNIKAFIAQWLAHWPPDSEIVSSNTVINIFRRIQSLFFFISLSFLFIFLNFEVKQCANIHVIILKGRQYWICIGKRSQTFLFFKMTSTPHKGKTRHIAWIST